MSNLRTVGRIQKCHLGCVNVVTHLLKHGSTHMSINPFVLGLPVRLCVTLGRAGTPSRAADPSRPEHSSTVPNSTDKPADSRSRCGQDVLGKVVLGIQRHVKARWGDSDRPEIADARWSGRLRGPKNTLQKVRGFAAHLLEWFSGPRVPPRPQTSTISGQPETMLLKPWCNLQHTGNPTK